MLWMEWMNYQSAEQIVIIASAQLNVLDVLDDDLGRQIRTAVQHHEFPAESIKFRNILGKLWSLKK